jgi:hypothetical protein
MTAKIISGGDALTNLTVPVLEISAPPLMILAERNEFLELDKTAQNWYQNHLTLRHVTYIIFIDVTTRNN